MNPKPKAWWGARVTCRPFQRGLCIQYSGSTSSGVGGSSSGVTDGWMDSIRFDSQRRKSIVEMDDGCCCC